MNLSEVAPGLLEGLQYLFDEYGPAGVVETAMLMKDEISNREIEVDVLSEEDVEAAVEALLADLGLSFAELEAQGRADVFCSEKARLAWFSISALVKD